MRQHPLTTSAALLFNSSSLITSPASRLRTGWLGLSIGLHLAAGAGLVVAPYFQFETLERPSLERPAQLVHLDGKPPLLGTGVKNERHPPDQPVKPQVEKPQKLQLPQQHTEVALNLEKPVVESGLPTGEGTDPNGQKDGSRDGTDLNGDPNSPYDGTPDDFGLREGNGPITYHAYDVNDPPRLLSHEDPVYPEAARQQGIEANVDLQLVVDETGRVVDASVVRSDNPMFNANAITAVRRWKYTAAKVGGRAVRTYKSVRIKFTLH